MRLLKTAFHPDVSPKDISAESELMLIERHAARGIVVRGESILLLYTQRYDDYSLPGGGIDGGEDKVAGLVRELQEETGAQGICNVKEFVRYDEYRPWYKPDAAIKHNEAVIAGSDKKGLSIERETFLLKEIAEKLMGSEINE